MKKSLSREKCIVDMRGHHVVRAERREYMPRKAALFDITNGSVLEAYFLLRDKGGNIPPNWITRTTQSRKKREKDLGRMLKASELDAVSLLKEWELIYRKECFYYGLRILLELQRKGTTTL
jgi:hypothetical protein